MSNRFLDNAVNSFTVGLGAPLMIGDTSIQVETGAGARAPKAPAKLVVWDSGNYEKPADDPLAETIRINADFSGDVCPDVTRGVEGSSETDHDTGVSTFTVENGPTAGLVEEIDAQLSSFRDDLDFIYGIFDGTEQFPVPIDIKPRTNFTVDLTNTPAGRLIQILTEAGEIDLYSYNGPLNLAAFGGNLTIEGDLSVDIFDGSGTEAIFGNDGTLRFIGPDNKGLQMSWDVGGDTFEWSTGHNDLKVDDTTGLSYDSDLPVSFSTTDEFDIDSLYLTMGYTTSMGVFGGIGVTELVTNSGLGIAMGTGGFPSEPYEGVFAADTGSWGQAKLWNLACSLLFDDTDGSAKLMDLGGIMLLLNGAGGAELTTNLGDGLKFYDDGMGGIQEISLGGFASGIVGYLDFSTSMTQLASPDENTTIDITNGRIGLALPGSGILNVANLPSGTSVPGGLSAGDVWVDTTGGLNLLKVV